MDTRSNGTYLDQVAKDRPFGWHYTQPYITPYFWFEVVDHFYWPKFVESHRNAAFYAGALYIVTIFALKQWMENRPAYQLKIPLFLWNLSLGIFSILGFWRLLPGFYYVVFQTENGFYRSLCQKEDLDVQTAFWVMLFAFSKFIELGDTVFIVLRKRPLVVLQWYHHLVTMGVTWTLAPLLEPIVRWYSVMNFGVHALMYPYFALRAIGIKIPTLIANYITTLQLTQMIVGLAVNITSVVYLKMGHECARYPVSIQLFTVVYGTFLVLFGRLFYNSVIKRGRDRLDVKEKSKKVD